MKNKLEIKIENLECEIEYTRATLISNSRSLAAKLEQLATILEENEEARPNSLGEVQSRGPELDLLCMQLNQQRSALKSLLDLKKALGE